MVRGKRVQWELRGAKVAGGPKRERAELFRVSVPAFARKMRRSKELRGEIHTSDGGPLTSEEQEELRRLRKEDRELEMERDFSRQAAAQLFGNYFYDPEHACPSGLECVEGECYAPHFGMSPGPG